jgi:dUTPase
MFYRLELLVSPEARDLYSQEILYRENTNAGYDLFVAKEATLNLGQVSEQTPVLTYMAMLDLGVKARMLRINKPTLGGNEGSEEVHFWLAPRSSIWKSGIMMANSMGIIDKSYRGSLMASVVPVPTTTQTDYEIQKVGDSDVKVYKNCNRIERQPLTIQRGQRLFQILAPDMGWIKEVRLVDSLPETSRGEGGFGSTGR